MRAKRSLKLSATVIDRGLLLTPEWRRQFDLIRYTLDMTKYYWKSVLFRYMKQFRYRESLLRFPHNEPNCQN